MYKPFKYRLFGLNNVEIPRILLCSPEICFFLLVHLKVQRIGSSETQEELIEGSRRSKVGINLFVYEIADDPFFVTRFLSLYISGPQAQYRITSTITLLSSISSERWNISDANVLRCRAL